MFQIKFFFFIYYCYIKSFVLKHVKKLKKSCQIFLFIVQKQKFMDNISENPAQKNVLAFRI